MWRVGGSLVCRKFKTPGRSLIRYRRRASVPTNAVHPASPSPLSRLWHPSHPAGVGLFGLLGISADGNFSNK
jgi:hypothetical protein